MKEITIRTTTRNEFLDITGQIRSLIRESGVEEGICTVYCPHTTAAITINENADPDVVSDLQMKLKNLIPAHENYRHREGNSDAHIKSSLVGNSIQLIVSGASIRLGTWQGVYFCEFDGPRSRRVWIQIN